MIVGERGPVRRIELSDADERLAEQRVEGAAARLGCLKGIMPLGDVAEEDGQLRTRGDGVDLVPAVQRREESFECLARLVGDRETIALVEDRPHGLGKALPQVAADQTANAEFADRMFIAEHHAPIGIEDHDAVRRPFEKICGGEVQHGCSTSFKHHCASPLTGPGARSQCGAGAQHAALLFRNLSL
jgi:hypothetical protein